LKSKSVFISDQVTDTQRINAQEVLAPKLEKKLLVYVEGSLDKEIIEHIDLTNVTVQIASQMVDNAEVEGKITVIQKVNEQNNTIGIVDMDYDFFNSEITNNPRIIDSNPLCTLFSFFYDDIDVKKIFSNVRRKFDTIGNCVNFRTVTPDVEKYFNRLNLSFKAISDNKLFRGFLYKENPKKRPFKHADQLPGRSPKISWKLLIDNFESFSTDVNNFVDLNDYEKYLRFRKKYHDQLSNCGINDHSIGTVLLALVWSEYTNKEIYKQASWIKRGEFSRWVEREIKKQIFNLGKENLRQRIHTLIEFIEKHQSEFDRQKNEI
jgi:hypothetical protein